MWYDASQGSHDYVTELFAVLFCFLQELEALVMGTDLEGRLVEEIDGTKYVKFNSLTTLVLKAFQELNDRYEITKEQQKKQELWHENMKAILLPLKKRVAALGGESV